LFINIHTHHKPKSNEWAIQSLYEDFDRVTEPGVYSIGLHPWYIDAQNWGSQLNVLKEQSVHKQVLAIGECGLDKVCSTNMELQVEVFTTQVQWANEIRKPLIIHCVRAFDEILAILAKQSVLVPVIFHGFTRNARLAAKIIEQGYYLSFGAQLQNESMQSVIRSIPLDKLFLETDTQDLSIELVYTFAAASLDMSTENLQNQLKKNTLAVFPSAFS